MNDFNAAIVKAIEENLPATIAKTAIERMSLAESVIEKNLKLEARVDELSKELKGYLALDKELDNKDRELTAKEIELRQREQGLYFKEIEAKVLSEYSTRSKEDIFRLVETVFKNPVVRQNLNGTVPVAQRQYAGGADVVTPHSYSGLVEKVVEGE